MTERAQRDVTHHSKCRQAYDLKRNNDLCVRLTFKSAPQSAFGKTLTCEANCCVHRFIRCEFISEDNGSDETDLFKR